MRVLVVGSGGREHAIIWKLGMSEKVEKIYVAPGNAGMAKLAERVAIDVTDISALRDFAIENAIDLTVVGPEVPLVLGIVDEFERTGLNVFGPNKKAALLEGSKTYSKEFMLRYNVPTAGSVSCGDYEYAVSHIEDFGFPVVLKADGLAAGKGVFIVNSREEAIEVLKEIMVSGSLGTAGSNVVIEEFLEGKELSVLCFSDGKVMIPMESAKDYKKALDNDLGPNTGGMGSVSPSPEYSDEIYTEFREKIMNPVLEGFESEGLVYKGVLYFGLIKCSDGLKVLEFNCRFGDPETQVLLPRLDTDLSEIFLACVEERLGELEINWNENSAFCVMLTSGGYPGKYEKGKEIAGLEAVTDDVMLFHSGTALSSDKLVTCGGRVIGVTALKERVGEARDSVYTAIEKISFDGKFYRNDIGK